MARRRTQRKPRVFYATRDGADSDIDIWLGMPQREITPCSECGNPHTAWHPKKGTRLLFEDVCSAEYLAAGLNIPPGGIVKFTIVVDKET